MTVFTKGRVLTDVVLQHNQPYNCQPAVLENNSLVALTAALQLTNASMQDVVGYPLEKTADETYTLLEAGNEASCNAILLQGPRRQLLDPNDSAASLASGGGATGRDYLVIDLFFGVVLAYEWMPAKDMWDAAFDKAALRTAVEVLGARVTKVSPTIGTL